MLLNYLQLTTSRGALQNGSTTCAQNQETVTTRVSRINHTRQACPAWLYQTETTTMTTTEEKRNDLIWWHTNRINRVDGQFPELAEYKIEIYVSSLKNMSARAIAKEYAEIFSTPEPDGLTQQLETEATLKAIRLIA
jgi:hypothetical protein